MTDSARRPELWFLVTGGHAFDENEIAERVTGLPEHTQVTVERLDGVPSHDLAPVDMQRIALRARDVGEMDGVSGVIVIHGTATLEYTSFLTDLFIQPGHPVVFTGATPRSTQDRRVDVDENLRDAALVALQAGASGHGVLVCFAGQVHVARDAWKIKRMDPNPFIGLRAASGSIAGGSLSLGPRDRARALSGKIDPRVAVVRAYPGAGSEPMQAAIRSRALGVVIEGFPGAGPVPSTMVPSIRDATQRGVIVVLSSRAPHGAIPSPPTGGTGDPLAHLGLISAGRLTTEMAMVLLMAALGEDSSLAAVKRCFDEVAWL
jgi:L-asparaginase